MQILRRKIIRIGVKHGYPNLWWIGIILLIPTFVLTIFLIIVNTPSEKEKRIHLFYLAKQYNLNMLWSRDEEMGTEGWTLDIKYNWAGSTDDLKVISLFKPFMATRTHSEHALNNYIELLEKQEDLQELVIENLHLDQRTFELISKVKSLKILGLINCEFEDEDFDRIGVLSNIIDLRIRGSDISDASLSRIAQFKSLTQLFIEPPSVYPYNIDSSKMTDVGVSTLSSLTDLEELGVSGTRLTNRGLNHLIPLKHLKKLDIGGTHVDENGVANFVETFRRYYGKEIDVTNSGPPKLIPDDQE